MISKFIFYTKSRFRFLIVHHIFCSFYFFLIMILWSKSSHQSAAPLKCRKPIYNRATGGEASSFYSRSTWMDSTWTIFCWLWGTEQDISLYVLYFKMFGHHALYFRSVIHYDFNVLYFKWRFAFCEKRCSVSAIFHIDSHLISIENVFIDFCLC